MDFYLSEKLTCDLGESCAAHSLTPGMARAGEDIRAGYQQGALAVIDQIAAGLEPGSHEPQHERAWALLSIRALLASNSREGAT